MGVVFVIGHRQPDTDSVGSVLGYAELLNRGEPGRFVAARCGEVNAESRFALETFGVEAPRFVESVEATVSDIPHLDGRHVAPDLPTIDVATEMDQADLRNMPITAPDGVLLGLVSQYTLARAYVRRQGLEPLSVARIRLDALARVLDGVVLVAAHEELEGRVYTSIDALHVALSRLTRHDVAVVGDDEPTQLALIAAGVAALVAADGAPVGERVVREARARGVSVLATTLDAFGVLKMISLSAPARLVMESDVPLVRPDDSLEYAKQVVATSKFRTACVVDAEHRFVGQLLRSSLMQDVSRSVVLLDHNEAGQAVEGIEAADILEIIDHHRLGVISTLKPVRFLNDPVGSTATLVLRRWQEAGERPSRAAAGMLLSGVLSDTLVLRMSTTTPEDRRAVETLAPLAGVDPTEYGMRLIRTGMGIEGVPLEDLLTRDVKRYGLFGLDVVIAQVMVPSFEAVAGRGAEVAACLQRLRRAQQVDLYGVLFTNVFEEASDLHLAADDVWLTRLGLRDQPLRMPKVMSRKKDFLPAFGQLLRKA